MILISNDQSFKSSYNQDDQLGDSIDIPTIILRNSEGAEIRRFITENPNSEVVLNIKFTGVKDGNLNIDLFMKSDDPKSLHFFKEFKGYYDKLSKLILN